ncbi:hypothetical protein ACEWY4_004085 [Coilia grayii]|uniref:Uncharacterized protein n=1 Tax=Coilia grayii TaxID=363190 RepID=A0ABD1KL35_9TELE
MSAVITVLAVLLASPLGRAFMLHLSEKEAADPAVPASPPQKPNRCQGELQQAIRRSLLQGLNLQQEPQHRDSNMAELRDKWKAALRASGYSGQPIQSPPSATGTSSDTAHSHFPHLLFLDLCWESWVIYPESFTFTQCSACSPPQSKPSDALSPAASVTGTSPQVLHHTSAELCIHMLPFDNDCMQLYPAVGIQQLLR